MIDPEVVSDAVGIADTAASASGVVVRKVDGIESAHAAASLFAGIWGRRHGQPVTPEMLRAMSKSGSYVVGAYREETLVGAAVAFHEEPALRTLHSHITGVVPGPWRNVGFALKAHQRAWALQREITRVAWTFDPLVARNAYFNIAKLRARPVEYLENFYGNMSDALNGTDDTDRLLLHWDLLAPDVIDACHGARMQQMRRHEAVPLLGMDNDGRPTVGNAPLKADALISVALPSDVARLRGETPEVAREWRVAVRAALVPLLRQGAEFVDFDRASDGEGTGQYVLRARSAPHRASPQQGVTHED
ncbi:GNAT family N-acetyltransferase [Microbacterium sp. NPDC076768]|uniref:GNAT family N-acetyltransferase n=1 Tax=Microbacterium sp. NPDC076768 TaxID=3154858 RepID=UPI00343648BB